MENIFITGVSGFLGAHLAKELLSQGKNVIGLEHDSKISHIDDLNIRDSITIIQGDLLTVDFDRIFLEYNIDTIFHLGGITIVSTANKLPEYTFNVNIMGTVRLFNACMGKDMESIMVASTDKVYGDRLDACEQDSITPSGLYATSKCCVDLISQSYADQFDLPICVTRCCNLVGFDRNSRIVPNVIKQCISGQRPVIWSGQDDIREYIYVTDVVSAYLTLANNINKSKGKCYNIGTGETATQSEIVFTIAEQFEMKPIIEPAPDGRDNELFEQSLNSNLIRSEFGWDNNYNLKETIIETIRQFEIYK